MLDPNQTAAPIQTADPVPPIAFTYFEGGETDCIPHRHVTPQPWPWFQNFIRKAAERAPGKPKSGNGYVLFCVIERSTPERIEAASARRMMPLTGSEVERARLMGYRDYAHIHSITAIGLDYDGRPQDPPNWDPAAWPGVVFAHSTHNWAPELPGKWRAIVPLARPITVDEYRRGKATFARMLPAGAIVRAPHQPAFMPTCPADRTVQFAEVPGAPLDWQAQILANVPAVDPQAAPQWSGQAEPMGPLPADLVDALATIVPPLGARHDFALRLGSLLGRSHWTADDALAFGAAVLTKGGAAPHTNELATAIDRVRYDRDPSALRSGWPQFKAKAGGTKDQIDAVCQRFQREVPGLAAPSPKALVAELTEAAGQSGATANDNGKPGKFDKQAARAALILTIGSAEEVAALIVKNKLARSDGADRVRAVFDEGRIWLPDDRGIWTEVPEHEIAQWTAEYDGVVYDFTDKGRPIWLKIGAGFTSSTLKQIQKEIAAPGFFSAVPAGVAFQNGFLNLKTRQFEEGINVAHRVRAVLPYDYDPDPPAPVHWTRYLESIWKDDAGELDTAAVNLVHQILGYLIAGRHEQEKVFLLLGPPRAGKGVLLKLIQKIFGDQACSFKLVNLGNPFALQSFLGKSVAYDPDARRSSANETKANERLLSTSSHDDQQVERKNQTALSVALPTRILIAANPPFGLSDLGGAVASRMMVLTFPKSFLGKEDKGLLSRLVPEIPAIVARALAALDDLDDAGGFVEPESSAEARTTLARAENPMAGFLDDWCIVDTTSPVEQRPTIDAGVLYAEMKAWCSEKGHKAPSDQKFSEILAQRGITQHRPNTKGRARIYRGVKLNQ